MGACPDISEGGQGGCKAALAIRMSYVYCVFDRPSTFSKNKTPYSGHSPIRGPNQNGKKNKYGWGILHGRFWIFFNERLQ